jgi:LysM repeat protein/predicted small lipoprotein YifL
MRTSAVTLLAAALLFSATGCGRYAPGFIVTDDGRTLANTDDNNRQLAIDSIRRQLDQQLGGHWRTAVTFVDLPVYEEGDERANLTGGWRWPTATVTVELVGDGSAPLPMTTDAVHGMLDDYLAPKVDHPSRNLHITVTSTVDAPRFTALGAPVASTTAAAPITITAGNGATPTANHYTVQAGDTFADISFAFYGTPDHWRLIRDANPGVTLKPGTVLTIPPKP